MVGATSGGLLLTITVGWGSVLLSAVPPPLTPENAAVVQVVTPDEVNATAANVKVTYSPVFRAPLPPVAVTLMVLGVEEAVQNAVGLRI